MHNPHPHHSTFTLALPLNLTNPNPPQPYSNPNPRLPRLKNVFDEAIRVVLVPPQAAKKSGKKCAIL